MTERESPSACADRRRRRARATPSCSPCGPCGSSGEADRVLAPSTAVDAVGRAESIVRQACPGVRVERLVFVMGAGAPGRSTRAAADRWSPASTPASAWPSSPSATPTSTAPSPRWPARVRELRPGRRGRDRARDHGLPGPGRPVGHRACWTAPSAWRWSPPSTARAPSTPPSTTPTRPSSSTRAAATCRRWPSAWPPPAGSTARWSASCSACPASGWRRWPTWPTGPAAYLATVIVPPAGDAADDR